MNHRIWISAKKQMHLIYYAYVEKLSVPGVVKFCFIFSIYSTFTLFHFHYLQYVFSLFFCLSTGQTWNLGSFCTKAGTGSLVWSSSRVHPPQVSKTWAEICQKALLQTVVASGLLYGHKDHLEEDRHSQTRHPLLQSHHKRRHQPIQVSCKSSKEAATDCCSKDSHFCYILPMINAHQTIPH